MNGVNCNESDHTAFILLVLHGKFGNCKKINYDLLHQRHPSNSLSPLKGEMPAGQRGSPSLHKVGH